jgi:limonene-1,2-epoxide hydrolase
MNTSRRNVLVGGALVSFAVAARAASAASAPSKNVQTIEAFIKAAETRDVDAQMVFFPDDGIYHNMPDEPIVGKEKIRALLTGYSKMEKTEIIMIGIAEARPGLVLTERLDRFLSKGKWIELPVMGAAEVENGKIKIWRDYYDPGHIEKQAKKQAEKDAKK